MELLLSIEELQHEAAMLLSISLVQELQGTLCVESTKEREPLVRISGIACDLAIIIISPCVWLVRLAFPHIRLFETVYICSEALYTHV